MGNYILESTSETERLNYQFRQRNYRPTNEIDPNELKLTKGIVLDAGCGTGAFSRYIAALNEGNIIQIYAVDSSERRIVDAKNAPENIPYKNINFSTQDLRNLNFPDNSIDMILCRFVYEHIKDICQEVSRELFRVLKTGGRLFITDCDGVLFNMDSEDQKLNEYLTKIKSSNFNFGPYICRKIPRYLQRAGFLQRHISIQHRPMLFFENEDRIYEKTLWEMRFEQIKSVFTSILGENDYKEFTKCFISELMNPQNFLYYNKFIFKVMK